MDDAEITKTKTEVTVQRTNDGETAVSVNKDGRVGSTKAKDGQSAFKNASKKAEVER